ncbi:MAG: hypothetical protein QGH45_22345 [Myxococcota bacterium]|nr:hypothetical protein [Myxococcota bacterium]
MAERAPGESAKGGWIPALAGYAALALALIGPALRHPLRLVTGHPDSDIYKHLWHHWLVRDGLTDGMVGCYRIPWLNAPDGACLFDADLVNNLAVLPVAALSIPLAVHLVVAGQLIAGAAAANLLARRVTGDRQAAFAAGCAYAFSCYVLFHPIASGVHERLHLALPALGLVLALRVRDGGGWRPLALLGAVMAILALASPAYSVFLGLALALVVPLDLALASGSAAGPSRGRAAARWAAVGLVTLLAFAVSGGLTSRCVSEESRGGAGFGGAPDSLSTWPSTRDPQELAGKMETLPLECFFSPAGLEACASRDADFLYRFPYPGFLLLILALAGVIAGRSRRARALGAVGFLLLLISLGPVIRVHAGDPGYWIAHPTLWLARAVPFVHRIHIWQLVLLAQLLLGIGAAELIAARIPGRWRGVAAAGISLLILAEVAVAGRGALPLEVADTRVPPVYEELVVHDGQVRAPDQIVLDLPAHAANPRIGGGRYVWYQSSHQRAVPYAINPGRFEGDPLVRFVHDGVGSTDVAANAVDRWRTDGASWVVLHLDHASEDEAGRARAALFAAGATAVDVSGDHELFALIPRGR